MLDILYYMQYNIIRKRDKEVPERESKGEINMIYLNNDGDYITSDNFINCGNAQRDELSKVYHMPDAKELYDFLDGLDSWADIPADVFQHLAEACGVSYNTEEEADDLMERCEDALRKSGQW